VSQINATEGANVMPTFWISYGIAENETTAVRRRGVENTVKQIASKSWSETGPFAVFETTYGIDGVAGAISGVIDPSVDTALIGVPGDKAARVVGMVADQGLFALLPGVRKG